MTVENSNRLDNSRYRNNASQVLLAVLILSMLILSVRLFYLQIIKGSYHEMLSAQNSMRLQVVKAPRGSIIDRKGVIIARNRPSYQIAILPTQLKNPTTVQEHLLRFMDAEGKSLFDSSVISWSLERAKWRKFQPVVILEDAPYEVVALIEEHQIELPGIVALVESRRSYPFGAAAGHVLGYLDEVNELELEASKISVEGDSTPYLRGDRIGRKGLERRYEKYFRGKDGIRYVKVNAFGKEVELISEMPQLAPVPGSNLQITLDIKLQCYAESLMSDTVRGAVVAIDPRNGEVLVMASTPRMDGNIFSLSREFRAKAWATLALDPARPLNNRAISGVYEPGSTFKGIVSLASLRSGKIQSNQFMPRTCNGGYRFGNRVWKCWDPNGHGHLNIIDAFTQSCDVFYYQAGLTLGMRSINEVARNFGYGEKTGIDLDDEKSGTLMDSTIYAERFGKWGWRWSPGIILNLSIGQGQLSTPLQLANYVAGMAQGSEIYKPHLLREVRDASGNLIFQNTRMSIHKIQMTNSEHAAILKSMDQVVNAPKGTGGRARMVNYLVGGKTGSSENPHGGKTHALFICAAPLYNPRIAIAVVMENVGHGGSFAAPIAGAILKRFFENENGG